MTDWNSTFEGVPDDDDNISAGAEDIRNFKLEVRNRIAKDHYMDLAGTQADHGEHSKVTFHAPLTSNPAPGTEKGALFTKDVDSVAELHFQDEDDNVTQITTGGELKVDLTGAAILNPVGSVTAFLADTPPTGWLECNGAAVSRTTYSDLLAVISDDFGVGNGSTTFNLPDFRGYFLRGWDHGAGNDPDAASRTNRGDGTTGDYIGTKQADEFESHDHFDAPSLVTFDGSGGIGHNAASMSSVTAETDVGGNETRPKNINVMYIIKY
ncbi:MAG: tail fiber protein [Pseudodesulfovibrio sp.]|nr:tail fiber protein [Pseudodesulfovibrio sp.]